jgi:hypothetical protein
MAFGSRHSGGERGVAAWCCAVTTASAALGWLLGPVAMALPLAAGLVAVGVGRRTHPLDGNGEPLRMHLARARRGEDPTDVMVLRLYAGSPDVVRRLTQSLRVTDSACALRHGRVVELVAILDRDRLDRRALEHRLGAIASQPVQVGWARFPEDAYTLTALIDEARHRCRLSEHELDLPRSTGVGVALTERAG